MSGNDKTNDQVENKNESAEKTHGSHNAFMNEVVNPLVNGAVAKPWDAIAQLTNDITGHDSLPKFELSVTPGNSWIQGASSSIGSLVPFIAAGKLTGMAFSGTGRYLEGADLISSGGASATFLASDRSAMIVGAGLYGAAEDPSKGQSRLGSSLSSAGAFAAFEYGNKYVSDMSLSSNFIAGGLERAGLHATVGAIGGSGSLALSNVLTNGKFGSLDSIGKAGVSGAAMNVFLPEVQSGVGKLAHKMMPERPVSAAKFVEREGWQHNTELKKIVKQTPLSRVARGDSAEADYEKNIAKLGPNDGADTLGHELDHLKNRQSQEAELKKAIYTPKAQQRVEDIRLKYEQLARMSGNRVAEAGKEGAAPVSTDSADILKSKATSDVTYGQLFEGQAKGAVELSNHKLSVDYSGAGGMHGDGGNSVSATGELGPGVYPKPDVITDGNGVKWGEIIVRESPMLLKAGDLPLGSWERAETFPDGTISYNIKDGTPGTPSGSTVEFYSQIKTTDLGDLISISRYPDGTIDWGMLDGRKLTVQRPASTVDSTIPGPTSYGYVVAEGGLDPDTPSVYLSDRQVLDTYPADDPLHVTITKADGTTEQADADIIARTNDRAVYNLVDGGDIDVRYFPDGLVSAVKTPADGSYSDEFHVRSIEERYMPGTKVSDGTAESVVRQAGSVTYKMLPPADTAADTDSETELAKPYPVEIIETQESTGYKLSDGAYSEHFNPDHLLDVLPTVSGQALRGDILPDGLHQYLLTDGSVYKTRGDGQLINAQGTLENGTYQSIHLNTDGSSQRVTADGDTLTMYGEPRQTDIGTVFAEKKVNGATLYYHDIPTGSPEWSVARVDDQTGAVTYFGSNDTYIGTGQLARGLADSVPPASQPIDFETLQMEQEAPGREPMYQPEPTVASDPSVQDDGLHPTAPVTDVSFGPQESESTGNYFDTLQTNNLHGRLDMPHPFEQHDLGLGGSVPIIRSQLPASEPLPADGARIQPE